MKSISILFNRYHLAACVVLVSIIISTIGNAQDNEYTIQVEFFFDTKAIPGRPVLGYRLYMDDEIICGVGPVEPQIITCSFSAADGTYDFSLSAIYDRGKESPPSKKKKFTLRIGDSISQPGDIQVGPGDINGDGLIDLKDIITGLQILINAYSGNITLDADVNGDKKIGIEEILFDLNETSRNLN